MLTEKNDNNGDYMMLNRKTKALTHHPTDFSVIGKPEDFKKNYSRRRIKLRQIGTNLTRVSARNSARRDVLMDDVRQQDPKYVAHHVYKFQDTDDEVLIDDRILLTLRDDAIGELKKIKRKYHLKDAGRMGKTYVLRVTAKTKCNPVKTA